MIVSTWEDAGRFLEKAGDVLRQDEAKNGLMAGICLSLARHPQKVPSPPCLVTVEDKRGLVLCAVMTPPFKMVLCSPRPYSWGAHEALVREFLSRGWQVPGVLGPSATSRGFAIAWAEASGASRRLGARLRVLELREVFFRKPAAGRLRVAGRKDLSLVVAWMEAFHRDVFGLADHQEARRVAERKVSDGDLYLWEDGIPVSMAAKTRPTWTGIALHQIYTPPELRGRGYATACVAALSQLLLDSGWQFCTLFADRANPISNHVYQKVGYERVSDFEEYVLEPPAEP